MKHWQETARVLERAVRTGRDGRASALAIVIATRGSVYRSAGAKLLIEDDGSVLGGVSGGCLEEDVRRVGLEVLKSGRSRVRHYDTGDGEDRVWGLGLGCEGHVDVVVHPISPESARGVWAELHHWLDADAAFALATLAEDGVPGGVLAVREGGRALDGLNPPALAEALEMAALAALRGGRSSLQQAASRRIFAEVLQPPPKLVVCGAGEDARPLVALAASVGFRVYVADHRGAYLDAARLPEAQRRLCLRADEASAELPADANTFAVVMTHSFEHDAAWLRRLIETDVAYVGVLGPRARTERILEELGGSHDVRIFGPVGLDLGAEGPEQVAVSVVAELLALRARREPRHLREREVPVHAGG